jgi:predicted DNA-binding protein (MmcQ/YjbR family)
MTREELLAYCLAKPGAWPDEPWEGDVVVKVASKIFAFLGSEPADARQVTTQVGLKCGASRDAADEWLARYPDDASVMAYIGRSGWNTLRVGGAIPDDEVREAIDASYDAVVSKLPRKDRPAPR